MTCTTADCESPATLFLCGHCIRDLQAWIDRVPDLRRSLFTTMSKLDQTAPQNREGGGGLSTGSAMPISDRAMDKRAALRIWEGQDAEQLAHDQYAGGFLPMLKQLIEEAERIIDNPPETRVITTCDCGGTVTSTDPKPEPTIKDPDPEDWGECRTCHKHIARTEHGTRARIQERVPQSMKTKDALKWMRDNAGISIASTDIRNWAREGKLIRTNPNDEGERPAYNVAEILAIHYRHAGANRRVASF